MEGQSTIFDLMYPKYKITKPIRLIEFFAGYGSQALALKYLGIEFEHWKICEWAIKSIQAYKDIHFPNEYFEHNEYDEDYSIDDCIEYLYKKGISSNYNKPMTREQIGRLSDEQIENICDNIFITHNLVNIQQVHAKDLRIIDTDKYTYLLTYSFPCQDLSLAGKGKGMKDTSTRSGMLWEVERILTECKELGTMPEVLLMENVPQVHGANNVDDFNKWQLRLEELGYNNYFQDLIATDYGIPQTRNRCFMVSILGDYSYTFPKPIPLKLKLKDMLEDNVDEKYYLSDKMINFFYDNEKKQQEKGNGFKFNVSDGNTIAKTVTTRAGSRMDDNFISKSLRRTLENNNISDKEGVVTLGNYSPSNHNASRIVDSNACSPTVMENYGTVTAIVENQKPKVLTGFGKIGSTGQYHQQNRVYDDNVAISVTTAFNPYYKNDLRIRKLTPKECFRLMGVKDEDFEKVRKNQSDNSLYHLVGDSIVVNVLMAIFKELLKKEVK